MLSIEPKRSALRPVRVYLDSSDYSTLSKPQLDNEAAAIRDRLIAWADSGEVDFRYSGAHISEMSPLQPQYVDAAKTRGELLVVLCGRKTLVSFDELMRREITAVAQDSGPPADVYSDTGDWFPPFKDFISPVSVVETVKKEFDAITKGHGMNRAQRRKGKKSLVKGNNLTAEAKQHLMSGKAGALKELLSVYPMREQDARVLHNLVIGTATAKEAEEAFLNSLRDPTWMIGWFEQHSEELSHVIQWARGPGEAMSKSLMDIAEKAVQLRELNRKIGLANQSVFLGFDLEAKQQLRLNVFVNMARRVAEATGVSLSNHSLEETRLSRNAVGLSVCITSAVDSMLNSLSATPRKPKDSDFIDVVHALYVPYVDVFRADGYMAPIIAKAAQRCGTKVVGKLTDLVGAIEKALKEKAGSEAEPSICQF